MKNKTNKLAKILSTITLTNIIVAFCALTLSFSMPVFAKPLTAPATATEIANLNTALKIQQKNQCITELDRANGWIITFMEEPLSLKEETTDNLKTRICYRNTLRFLQNDGTEKTITELSKVNKNQTTGCSEKAETIMKNTTLVNQLKISYSCRAIMAILAKGGTSFIEAYIGLIYRWAAGLVGLIAVAVIIISSIQISFAGGETEAVNKAKGRIIKSIAGIAVLFLSGLILYTTNPTFFTR
ncbi:hypothetical protein COY05_03595 [Candidatus Peregrinibacteria bacterium CG_4_10_14_0_2_um_filter_38_24]|nr:MAG: hypothetical protein COY05_03595 [Candidatus Peregrinibacteria bacterium CG_4_10_14_0_2_um_filter_38_24]PJC39189.1 MAG: hypothetical protein CO044_01070 [Candidatus Peregrinibacteria bacterium CG_4_9_14_0_2_um_filter_38_9]